MPRTYRCRKCGVVHSPLTGKHCREARILASAEREEASEDTVSLLREIRAQTQNNDRRVSRVECTRPENITETMALETAPDKAAEETAPQETLDYTVDRGEETPQRAASEQGEHSTDILALLREIKEQIRNIDDRAGRVEITGAGGLTNPTGQAEANVALMATVPQGGANAGDDLSDITPSALRQHARIMPEASEKLAI